jgi:signal transduction histidine kinase
MAAVAFDILEPRAGTAWLAHEGRERQGELLVALLSRFNHDLRTPLNTVVGWTHLLQQGLVDSSRSKHVADVLARNTREQTVLLDEFVDDGRALLGVLRLDPVGLRIDDVVARAMERAGPVASLHGVSFVADTRMHEEEVEGDERRLPRLVYRLLIAVARRARESATVELSTEVDDGRIALRIDAPVGEGDWSDAALLDLRISSFVAAMHGAELCIDGGRDRAAVVLRLPLRP